MLQTLWLRPKIRWFRCYVTVCMVYNLSYLFSGALLVWKWRSTKHCIGGSIRFPYVHALLRICSFYIFTFSLSFQQDFKDLRWYSLSNLRRRVPRLTTVLLGNIEVRIPLQEFLEDNKTVRMNPIILVFGDTIRNCSLATSNFGEDFRLWVPYSVWYYYLGSFNIRKLRFYAHFRISKLTENYSLE